MAIRALNRVSWLALAAMLLSSSVGLADEPGVELASPDEPALASAGNLVLPGGFWSLKKRGPQLKFSYRTWSVGELGGRSNRYHTFAVERYFISSILRASAGLEGGLDSSEKSNILLLADVALGAQYPCRLNPFVEFTASSGLFHRDILQQSLFELTYQLGVDSGVDFFVTEKLVLSLAAGWRRLVFRQPGDEQVEAVYVYYDSFTLKAGFGF